MVTKVYLGFHRSKSHFPDVEQSVHDMCHGFKPGWDHGGSVVISLVNEHFPNALTDLFKALIDCVVVDSLSPNRSKISVPL